jgi:hypothetical protein
MLVTAMALPHQKMTAVTINSTDNFLMVTSSFACCEHPLLPAGQWSAGSADKGVTLFNVRPEMVHLARLELGRDAPFLGGHYLT